MDEKFMEMAIEKAWKGARDGQEPFGACVVMDDEVVSVSHNTVRKDNDVTAHAEMNAIRDACRKLMTTDLSGCQIYATFKPCKMCEEACKRAKISTIYYGAGPADVNYPDREYSLEIRSGILKDQCLELVGQVYPIKT